MEDNKELVTNVTENVEEQATEELVDGAKAQTTEENVNAVDEATANEESVEEKLYSESEFNQKLDELLAQKIGKKLANQERKLRREYEDKYSKLENVLRAGTGEDDLEAITNTFEDFYTKRGVKIPQTPNYSSRDLEVLANQEAKDIISMGYEDIVEEVDRLAEKGVDRMTPREKIVFQKLATERQKQESEKELASIGVGKDLIESEDFKEFTSKLNPNLSLKDQYELYSKFKPKPKVEQIGSMKNTKPNKIKDYYTPEEARRLTSKDLDNPEVMKAVERSMQKWYEEGI